LKRLTESNAKAHCTPRFKARFKPFQAAARAFDEVQEAAEQEIDTNRLERDDLARNLLRCTNESVLEAVTNAHGAPPSSIHESQGRKARPRSRKD
jgi:hypothetical protein